MTGYDLERSATEIRYGMENAAVEIRAGLESIGKGLSEQAAVEREKTHTGQEIVKGLKEAIEAAALELQKIREEG